MTQAIPIDDGNCFVCGPDNPIGMHLHFKADPERGPTAVFAQAILRPEFQGWKGVGHGGAVTALLDDAMAYAAGAAGHRGMTASLTTRFRKPVPLGEPVIVRGHVVSERRHIIFVEATIESADGTLLVEGDGKFVSRGAVSAVQDRLEDFPERFRRGV